jgi:hypothetical protein
MTTVEHVGVSTGLTYEGLVGAFERELGRWDPVTGNALVERRAPWSDVEREVERMAGKHGLMIFFRADQGAGRVASGQSEALLALSCRQSGHRQSHHQHRYPRALLCAVPRLSLRADEPGGAVISYDRPSSFLDALGRPELKEIGAMLDQKIDGVVDALRKS